MVDLINLYTLSIMIDIYQFKCYPLYISISYCEVLVILLSELLHRTNICLTPEGSFEPVNRSTRVLTFPMEPQHMLAETQDLL